MRKQLHYKTARRRSKGGQYNVALFREVERVINKRILKPEIVNPDSNFVVITYWWGRGNINKNFQRPCASDAVSTQVDARKQYIDNLMIESHRANPSQYKPKEAYRKAVEQAATEDGKAAIAQIAKGIYDAIPQVEPIKYEEMMEIWKETCRASGVNFMAVEYPEFAVKGGYQFAINAKPYFIRKALEACDGRAVLYIDGDMNVRKYPHIFDMKNVDFMARGWNMDPRSKWNYEDAAAVDYYTFETSGGIMFFANTIQAKRLLELWIAATSHPSMWQKADDRILSWVFNNFRCYLAVNFIQLPIEYLYLTLAYDRYLNKKHHVYNANGRKTLKGPADYDAEIFIDHPECLTPEEVAMEASTSATNRQPEFYNENITERVTGERGGGWMWQYVMYDSPKMKDAMAMYEFYVNTHEHIYTEEYENEAGEIIEEEIPAMYPVPYEQRYGRKLNGIALQNIKGARRLAATQFQIKNITTSAAAAKGYTVVQELAGRNSIHAILSQLLQGRNVLFVPANVNSTYMAAVEEEIAAGESEFIAVNITPTKKPENTWELYSEYRPTFATDAPIYFSATNRIVLDLLKITRSIAELARTFKSSILFLTRIRCSWVALPRSKILAARNFYTDSVRKALRPPPIAVVQKIAARILSNQNDDTQAATAAIMNQLGSLTVQILFNEKNDLPTEIIASSSGYPVVIDSMKPIMTRPFGPMNAEEAPVGAERTITSINVSRPILGGGGTRRKRRRHNRNH